MELNWQELHKNGEGADPHRKGSTMGSIVAAYFMFQFFLCSTIIYLERIFETQPWETRSCLEMSHGRTPLWASSTIRWRTTSGRGLPLTNTPPNWFTPPWPTQHHSTMTRKNIYTYFWKHSIHIFPKNNHSIAQYFLTYIHPELYKLFKISSKLYTKRFGIFWGKRIFGANKNKMTCACILIQCIYFVLKKIKLKK